MGDADAKAAELAALPGLTPETRMLCLAFAALARGEGELLSAAARALHRSGRADWLRELCLLAVPYFGFPRALAALADLAPLLAPPTTRVERRGAAAARGRRAFDAVYGEAAEQVLAELARLDPDLPDLVVEVAYGRFLGPCRLPGRERELAGVAGLVALALPRQTLSHARGALLHGATPREVLEAAHTAALAFPGAVSDEIHGVLASFLKKRAAR